MRVHFASIDGAETRCYLAGSDHPHVEHLDKFNAIVRRFLCGGSLDSYGAVV